MKTKSITLTLCIICLALSAIGQTPASLLFKGTVGTRAATLYLRPGSNSCTGATEYTGMYKYDRVSKWLALNIQNDEAGHLLMVEQPMTGLLLMIRHSNTIDGAWHSPDGKRSIRVKLTQSSLSPQERAVMEENFEKTNYEANDC